MDFDIVIIGAGAVGLACAVKVSALGLNTLLIERNDNFGMETSSRNSEVIHAGIYYPKGSLKSDLCVRGKYMLYDWCKKYNVPHRMIGKFIVAIDQDELPGLDRILSTAKKNGVRKIEHVSKSEILKQESNLNIAGGLFSAETGIIDSHSYMKSLEQFALANNCTFAYRHKPIRIERSSDHYNISVEMPDGDSFSISSKFVINAAGLDSDKVAELANINIDKAGYRLHWCRGHYFRLRPGLSGMVGHLVYPVTPKSYTGLGIHITLELDGQLKLGPDTMYINRIRQDYSVPASLHDKFLTAAQRYLPFLKGEDISPDQSGIRPKLQPESDNSFHDFIIKEETDKGLPGFINLIGIESPGLTSSLAIADMVGSFLE